MEWLDSLTYNKTLRTSFIIYMMLFLMIGLCLTKVSGIVIGEYKDHVQELYLVEEIVEEGQEKITYFHINEKGPTSFQKILVAVLNIYNNTSLIVNTFIFSILGFLIYFNDKIRKPLDEVKQLQIALQEECPLETNNELLNLSHNYNKLVEDMKIKKKNMWCEVERIEQMLDSFEHDIRTPITIIRGHNDMILSYYLEGKMNEEKLKRTLISSKLQINRLDQYVSRMSRLRNIKELELDIKYIESKVMSNIIADMGRYLSKEKQFKFKSNLKSNHLYLDQNILLEIYENILTNAFRYAKDLVSVSISEQENDIIIKVQDDGIGFSSKALKYGTIAFFSEDKSNGSNKGLGLNICRELCEKHGGSINISNTNIGALVEIRLNKINSNIDKK